MRSDEFVELEERAAIAADDLDDMRVHLRNREDCLRDMRLSSQTASAMIAKGDIHAALEQLAAQREDISDCLKDQR